MPFSSHNPGLVSTLVVCLLFAGGCDQVREPEAPPSFGVQPTPPPPPPPRPIPTSAPPGTPAPPPEQLTVFLSQCPDQASTRLTLYQFRATSLGPGGTRFHGWHVRRSRDLTSIQVASVLSWLRDPSTYFPDDCMCSSDPPDFGFRISCSGAHLDLVLDMQTLRVLGSDDHRSINEHVHKAFVQALQQAIRGGV